VPLQYFISVGFMFAKGMGIPNYDMERRRPCPGTCVDSVQTVLNELVSSDAANVSRCRSGQRLYTMVLVTIFAEYRWYTMKDVRK
jgi:hypothetical protein